MVSRAIRISASASYIRILSLENLDTVLPAELGRLDTLKVMTQAKYRFLVHRRTMLLQALNSSSEITGRKDDDGIHVVNKLTAQLSQTMAECDLLMEDLLHVNDQISQITKMIDLHWASALAIALRKVCLTLIGK